MEGPLNPVHKGTRPLDTYHVDHLGLIPSTRKSYNHLFVVVDSFTKFYLTYPTKTTNAIETIDHLSRQATIFGNPRRIVSDWGSAFTSNAFTEYCKAEGIEVAHIVTGVLRGNWQFERVNRITIPVLTKLSMSNLAELFKHLDSLQQHIDSSFCRSIGMTPYEFLVGTKMKVKDDLELCSLLDEEIIASF